MVEDSASISRTPAEPTRHRFYLLDGLRFVAAFAVMAFHYTSVREDADAWGEPVTDVFPVLSQITAFGALGVQLFFIISGFVILMSTWGRTLPEFVSSRVGRLYPAYWLAVILTTFVVAVLEDRQVSLGRFLMNLTMIHRPFGIGDIDGVYWTLWAEMRFYLIMAVFVVIGITTNRVIALCAVWPILEAIGRQAGNPALNQILIANWASLFCGGMILYVMYRNGPSLVTWLVFVENAFAAAYQVTRYQLPTTEESTGQDMSDTLYFCIILAFFAVMALITQTRLRELNWPWLTTLGALTYPLYLIHAHWGWAAIRIVYPSVDRYVAVAIAMAVSLTMAWLINRFVEKPFGPKLRRAVLTALNRHSDPTRHVHTPV